MAANFDIFEPRVTAAEAGGDAVLSLVLAFLVTVVMTAVLLELGLRFRQTNVVGYAVSLLGSPLAGVYELSVLFPVEIGLRVAQFRANLDT